MRPFFQTTIAAILLAAAGCGGCTKEPGRVTVILHSVDGKSTSQVPVDSGFAQWGEGKDARRVEVKDGQLRVLGKDYGPIAAGDTIIVDNQDVVTVNGDRRAPR